MPFTTRPSLRVKIERKKQEDVDEFGVGSITASFSFTDVCSDWRMMEVGTVRDRSNSRTGPARSGYQRQYLFHSILYLQWYK